FGGVVETDRERRARERRREQEIVPLEEPAGVVEPGQAVEERLDERGRRALQRLVDDAQEPGVDLVPLARVGRQPRRDPPREDRPPRGERRWPAGVDLLDPAAELAEGARGLAARLAHLGIHDLRVAERVAVGDAQALDAPPERLYVIDPGRRQRTRVALVGAGGD